VFVECLAVLILLLGQQGALVALKKKKRSAKVSGSGSPLFPFNLSIPSHLVLGLDAVAGVGSIGPQWHGIESRSAEQLRIALQTALLVRQSDSVALNQQNGHG
jgi:hypothetical protein